MNVEKNKNVTIVTEENFMECMREFDAYYWKKKCDKGSVSETLNRYVNSKSFLELLDKMKNKSSDWNEGYGMLFPEDFDDPDNPDDEENIGENNICFFSGPDYDDIEDIIGYEEFYKYLVPACEFYVERRHPEHKEIVEQKLKEIRKVYGLKKGWKEKIEIGMKKHIIKILVILSMTLTLTGCINISQNNEAIKQLRKLGYEVEIIDKRNICVIDGEKNYYYKFLFGKYIFQSYRIDLCKSEKRAYYLDENIKKAILEVRRENINKYKVNLDLDTLDISNDGKSQTLDRIEWFECKSDFDSKYFESNSLLFDKDPLGKQKDSYIYITKYFYSQKELIDTYQKAKDICNKLNK